MHVQSLGREDPLEEGMATHPSILAWRIPWTEESGGLQSMGLQRVGHDGRDVAHTPEEKAEELGPENILDSDKRAMRAMLGSIDILGR